MNSIITTPTSLDASASALAEVQHYELRQDRIYSINHSSTTSPSSTTSSTPHSSPIASLNSQSLTTSNPTLAELKAIEAEMKDVVLNASDAFDDDEADDDETPEDGSWITGTVSPKGNEYDYDDPLPPHPTLDGMDVVPALDPKTSSVQKSETYRYQLDSLFQPALSIRIPGNGPGMVYTASSSHSGNDNGLIHKNAFYPRSCSFNTASSSEGRSGTEAIVLTVNHNYPEPVEAPVTNISQLNRCDLSEVRKHANLLDPAHRNYLQSVRSKVEYWPGRFRDSDQYLRQSQILLMSNGWTSANRYSKCCIKNKVNLSGECRLHKFCPYCSWRVVQTKVLTYVPAFEDGTWHFLTGSYKENLSMQTPGDVDQWLVYWNAYGSALSELVEAGDIRGVFWTEELAAISMLPMQVLPHIHAIIEVDEVSVALKAKLLHLVSKNLGDSLETPLQPNTRWSPIKNEGSLYHHLRYMIKPVNFVKAYEKAWPAAQAYNRYGAQQLNSHLTDLVLGYSSITTDRRKLNAKGNLDPKRKDFIGIKKKKHKKFYGVINRIAKAPTKYIEMGEETV